MTAIVRKNATSRPGAKRILGLSGPFAIGKTTLIQRWAGERYNAWTAECAHDRRGRPVYYTTDCEHDLNPVVWAGLASKAKATDVNAEILHYHGLPGKDSHKAFDAMKRHRTRVLVLDNRIVGVVAVRGETAPDGAMPARLADVSRESSGVDAGHATDAVTEEDVRAAALQYVFR